jgi:hypothetical protein
MMHCNKPALVLLCVCSLALQQQAMEPGLQGTRRHVMQSTSTI